MQKLKEKMLSKYLLPRKKICSRIIDEEQVILNLEDSSFYFLNSVGSSIWSLANGKTSIGKIINRITREFNVDLNCVQKDALDFVKNLSRLGLLRIYDKPKVAPKR